MTRIYLFDSFGSGLSQEETPLDFAELRNDLRTIRQNVRTLNSKIPVVTDGGKHDDATAKSDEIVIKTILFYLEQYRSVFAETQRLVDKISGLSEILELYTEKDREYFGLVTHQQNALTPDDYERFLPELDDDDGIKALRGHFFLWNNDATTAELSQSVSDSLFEVIDGLNDFIDQLVDKWGIVKEIFYQQDRSDFDGNAPLEFSYPDGEYMHSFTHHNGPYTFGYVQHNRPLKEARKEVVKDFTDTVASEGKLLSTLSATLKSTITEMVPT